MCAINDSTTEIKSNLAPSDLALSELIGNTMMCPVVNNAVSQWIMTVIFDTRENLAITPELSDFYVTSEAASTADETGRYGKRN
jgi:hypothetical protein